MRGKYVRRGTPCFVLLTIWRNTTPGSPELAEEALVVFHSWVSTCHKFLAVSILRVSFVLRSIFIQR